MTNLTTMTGLTKAIAMLIGTTLFCLSTYSVNAQEKKHSIEFTTGIPSIVTILEYPLDLSISFKGQEVDTVFPYGINLGYTYSLSRRWELNPMLHLHLNSYQVKQYPEINNAPTDNSKGYDWDAEPTVVDKSTKLNGSVNVAFRYKWLLRDSFCIYSALGVGFSNDLTLGLGMHEIPCPLPYISPIGIKFGKGKVYGIAEANISASNTFAMAGVGIRL